MEDTEKRPEFQPGDVASLRGSNFRMTVEVVGNRDIRCVWVHEGVVSREVFSSAVLWNVTRGREQADEQYRALCERAKTERVDPGSVGWADTPVSSRTWFKF